MLSEKTRWDNNGVETITFHDVENQQDAIYMIFVHHYGSNRVAEEFGSSGVHLTLTDGQVSTAVAMEADSYNGEENWLAGCIKIVGTSFEEEGRKKEEQGEPFLRLPSMMADANYESFYFLCENKRNL